MKVWRVNKMLPKFRQPIILKYMDTGDTEWKEQFIGWYYWGFIHNNPYMFLPPKINDDTAGESQQKIEEMEFEGKDIYGGDIVEIKINLSSGTNTLIAEVKFDMLDGVWFRDVDSQRDYGWDCMEITSIIGNTIEGRYK